MNTSTVQEYLNPQPQFKSLKMVRKKQTSLNNDDIFFDFATMKQQSQKQSQQPTQQQHQKNKENQDPQLTRTHTSKTMYQKQNTLNFKTYDHTNIVDSIHSLRNSYIPPNRSKRNTIKTYQRKNSNDSFYSIESDEYQEEYQNTEDQFFDIEKQIIYNSNTPHNNNQNNLHQQQSSQNNHISSSQCDSDMFKTVGSGNFQQNNLLTSSLKPLPNQQKQQKELIPQQQPVYNNYTKYSNQQSNTNSHIYKSDFQNNNDDFQDFYSISSRIEEYQHSRNNSLHQALLPKQLQVIELQDISCCKPHIKPVSKPVTPSTNSLPKSQSNNSIQSIYQNKIKNKQQKQEYIINNKSQIKQPIKQKKLVQEIQQEQLLQNIKQQYTQPQNNLNKSSIFDPMEPVTDKNYYHTNAPVLSKDYIKSWRYQKPSRYMQNLNYLQQKKSLQMKKDEIQRQKITAKNTTLNLTMLFHCYLREYPKMIHWARFQNIQCIAYRLCSCAGFIYMGYNYTSQNLLYFFLILFIPRILYLFSMIKCFFFFFEDTASFRIISKIFNSIFENTCYMHIMTTKDTIDDLDKKNKKRREKQFYYKRILFLLMPTEICDLAMPKISYKSKDQQYFHQQKKKEAYYLANYILQSLEIIFFMPILAGMVVYYIFSHNISFDLNIYILLLFMSVIEMVMFWTFSTFYLIRGNKQFILDNKVEQLYNYYQINK